MCNAQLKLRTKYDHFAIPIHATHSILLFYSVYVITLHNSGKNPPNPQNYPISTKPPNSHYNSQNQNHCTNTQDSTSPTVHSSHPNCFLHLSISPFTLSKEPSSRKVSSTIVPKKQDGTKFKIAPCCYPNKLPH